LAVDIDRQAGLHVWVLALATLVEGLIEHGEMETSSSSSSVRVRGGDPGRVSPGPGVECARAAASGAGRRRAGAARPDGAGTSARPPRAPQSRNRTMPLAPGARAAAQRRGHERTRRGDRGVRGRALLGVAARSVWRSQCEASSRIGRPA
jgi:hypothetical protein